MALRRLCLGALQKVQHTWQLTGPPTPQLALAGACQAQQPLPSLADAMRDMLGSSLWLAVPKHKVSHSRKRQRTASNFIKLVPVVSQCKLCGKVFKQHQLPHKCTVPECPCGRGSPRAAED